MKSITNHYLKIKSFFIDNVNDKFLKIIEQILTITNENLVFYILT